MISGAAGYFTREYGAIIEAPMAFLFMAYLTVLGSVIRGKVTLSSAINPQPRLFILLLGSSADERKSTVLKIVKDTFADALD